MADWDSNRSRMLRATTENLSELADKYDETGQLDERDQVNDAAEAVRSLSSLPEPSDDG